jgi:hypothetical protein
MNSLLNFSLFLEVKLHKEEGRKEGIIQELAPLCDFVLFCVVFPCDFCIVQHLRQQRTLVSINWHVHEYKFDAIVTFCDTEFPVSLQRAPHAKSSLLTACVRACALSLSLSLRTNEETASRRFQSVSQRSSFIAQGLFRSLIDDKCIYFFTYTSKLFFSEFLFNFLPKNPKKKSRPSSKEGFF